LCPVARKKMGHLELCRSSLAVHSDGCYTVQPQEHQVHEIILGERLLPEMGMYQAEPSKMPAATAAFGQVGDV